MAPSFTTRSSSYHERLGVLHRWRQLARQFAVGAEVLEVFDFEFRGDGHRNPGPVWYRGGPGPRVPAGCAVEVRTGGPGPKCRRSEEHTSELQSLMRNSYAVLCLQKKIQNAS